MLLYTYMHTYMQQEGKGDMALVENIVAKYVYIYIYIFIVIVENIYIYIYMYLFIHLFI